MHVIFVYVYYTMTGLIKGSTSSMCFIILIQYSESQQVSGYLCNGTLITYRYLVITIHRTTCVSQSFLSFPSPTRQLTSSHSSLPLLFSTRTWAWINKHLCSNYHCSPASCLVAHIILLSIHPKCLNFLKVL